jgi:hypothetical protein
VTAADGTHEIDLEDETITIEVKSKKIKEQKHIKKVKGDKVNG